MESNSMKSEQEPQSLLEKAPAPPEGSPFRLQKLEYISVPHPYCLTPKHVEVAADHHGGILDHDAILDVERRGARCGIGRHGSPIGGESPCNLPYDQHEHLLTLFVEMDDNTHISTTPGLHPYLLALKQWSQEEKAEVEGFCFPQKGE
jgi:hypothetical protein